MDPWGARDTSGDATSGGWADFSNATFAGFGDYPKTPVESANTADAKEETNLASTAENAKLQQKGEGLGDNTIENVAQATKDKESNAETKTAGSGEIIENKTLEENVESTGSSQQAT